MIPASGRPLVTVLYVGTDLSDLRRAQLHTLGIGIVVAESASRARRWLTEFRPSALVLAAPDLKALASLSEHDLPVVVLAAAAAPSDLGGVTILSRRTDTTQLAAVLHGLSSASRRREAEAA